MSLLSSSAPSQSIDMPSCRGGSRVNAGCEKKQPLLPCKGRRIVRLTTRRKKINCRESYSKNKAKLLHNIKTLLELKISTLQEALSGQKSLDSLLLGEKRWDELSESQRGRLYRQATALSTYFGILKKNIIQKEARSNKTYKISPSVAREQAAALCQFKISARTIELWASQFRENDGKFPEAEQGKWVREWLLDQTDLKLEAVWFLHQFKKLEMNEEDYLTVDKFHHFLNNVLLPKLSLEELQGIKVPVSWGTARLWMFRLGYGYGTNSKNIYVNGHDRPDVLEYREEFLSRHAQ